jgi:hypothetical protein
MNNWGEIENGQWKIDNGVPDIFMLTGTLFGKLSFVIFCSFCGSKIFGIPSGPGIRIWESGGTTESS